MIGEGGLLPSDSDALLTARRLSLTDHHHDIGTSSLSGSQTNCHSSVIQHSQHFTVIIVHGSGGVLSASSFSAPQSASQIRGATNVAAYQSPRIAALAAKVQRHGADTSSNLQLAEQGLCPQLQGVTVVQWQMVSTRRTWRRNSQASSGRRASHL